MSSAKNWKFEDKPSGKSFMEIKNNNGPSIEY